MSMRKAHCVLVFMPARITISRTAYDLDRKRLCAFCYLSRRNVLCVGRSRGPSATCF
jgi:hypothetical protein